MDICQARDLKFKLENEILNLIMDYEKATTMHVGAVSTSTLRCKKDPCPKTIGVVIDIDFGGKLFSDR